MIEITKQLALQVFLHCVIVANKDIPTKNLIPGQCLSSRQSLKPFVNSIVPVDTLSVFVIAIAASVICVVATELAK